MLRTRLWAGVARSCWALLPCRSPCSPRQRQPRPPRQAMARSSPTWHAESATVTAAGLSQWGAYGRAGQRRPVVAADSSTPTTASAGQRQPLQPGLSSSPDGLGRRLDPRRHLGVGYSLLERLGDRATARCTRSRSAPTVSRSLARVDLGCPGGASIPVPTVDMAAGQPNDRCGAPAADAAQPLRRLALGRRQLRRLRPSRP